MKTWKKNLAFLGLIIGAWMIYCLVFSGSDMQPLAVNDQAIDPTLAKIDAQASRIYEDNGVSVNQAFQDYILVVRGREKLIRLQAKLTANHDALNKEEISLREQHLAEQEAFNDVVRAFGKSTDDPALEFAAVRNAKAKLEASDAAWKAARQKYMEAYNKLMELREPLDKVWRLSNEARLALERAVANAHHTNRHDQRVLVWMRRLEYDYADALKSKLVQSADQKLLFAFHNYEASYVNLRTAQDNSNTALNIYNKAAASPRIEEKEEQYEKALSEVLNDANAKPVQCEKARTAALDYFSLVDTARHAKEDLEVLQIPLNEAEHSYFTNFAEVLLLAE